MPNEKSSSSSISNRFFWFSVSTEYASCSVSFGCITKSIFERVMSPSMRSMGRSPAVMWRSDAPRSIISSSSTRRLSAEAPGTAGLDGGSGHGAGFESKGRRESVLERRPAGGAVTRLKLGRPRHLSPGRPATACPSRSVRRLPPRRRGNRRALLLWVGMRQVGAPARHRRTSLLLPEHVRSTGRSVTEAHAGLHPPARTDGRRDGIVAARARAPAVHTDRARRQ